MTMSKNNKCVVVYRSGSGFTKRYAEWIAEELNCNLLEGKNVKIVDLIPYETIIYGGGLYAIGVNGLKLITKNFNKLKDKKLIVFAVGATPVRQETTEEIINANIPREQQDKISFYYFRGGFDYNRLNRLNKIVMNLMKMKLKHTKNPNPDEKGMLASYDRPLDFTKKTTIEPLIKQVKGY